MTADTVARHLRAMEEAYELREALLEAGVSKAEVNRVAALAPIGELLPALRALAASKGLLDEDCA